jgi:NDP-sugar pyrophosphorylase family protein
MSGESVDLDDWPIAILAGGLATRLRPVTEKIPKALIHVAGQPFLAHQLRLLSRAGLRKMVLCAGYRGEMIEEEFGDGSSFGVEMRYSYDGPELLGTGGALKKALPLLGKRFLVLYGDSYLPIDYAEPVGAFVASGKPGLMTLFQNEGRWDTSNVLFHEGLIQSYTKSDPTPEMRHIDYGLGVFSALAFSSSPSGKPFDLADVYQELSARGKLAGYEVNQRFYEIGSPSGLAELDAFLRTQPLSQTR